jgi:hypothetical protein
LVSAFGNVVVPGIVVVGGKIAVGNWVGIWRIGIVV